jgi:cytochrome c553
MDSDDAPFKFDRTLRRVAWGWTAALIVAGGILGFLVLPRYQEGGPELDTWNAICRALGITGDSKAASEPQPPLRTPTQVAWTSATLARIASGNQQNGSFVALNCAACHGDGGISTSGLVPTLAGMEAAALYKQLDDYHSGKRLWGVMNGVASALTDQDRADVAAYFARRSGGLVPITGEGVPQSGRSLRQKDPTIRLIFAGDPDRGLAPCAACHGPDGRMLGAPSLQGQQAAYIERQLASFAEGMRQNDINRRMRVIAQQLTPDEMKSISAYYGSGEKTRTAEK